MSYLYNSFIEIILRSYMKQERIHSSETGSDSYSLLDLHIGGSFHWGLQEFDITIAANNILDKDYYSHLSVLKDLSPVPVRDMGRNVAILLKFPFGLKR
jgi:iron complex outermembrane recepter protein